MSANPNYQGLLSIENLWAGAIFVKHLLFLIMIGVSIYITWGILPQLRRIALLRAKNLAQQSEEKQAQFLKQEESILLQETNLLRINLILGILVLALTAIARAA